MASIGLKHPLHPLFKLAVSAGSDQLVKLHIARGRDVNAKDESGRPLLAFAISKGRTETLRILLEAGADPHQKDRNGIDAFDLAHTSGLAEITALLEAYSRTRFEVAESTTSFTQPEEEASLCDSCWEEDVESPPPTDDPDFLTRAAETQAMLSSYEFIDPDEDWSEVMATNHNVK